MSKSLVNIKEKQEGHANRYISFSGGVESTTMCILYGKGAKAIFCDTGAEHESLYERLDKVEEYIKKLHGGDFELIRIKPKVKTKAGKEVNSLTDYINIYKYMPSGFSRFCTRLFKVQPIEQFLYDKGNIQMLIGLNYDESSRTGNLQKLKNCEYKYPLIDNELDRQDCIDILNLHGMNPEFPVYMQRGGCKYCFFKSEKEYRAMYYLNKKEFVDVMNFEESIQDQRKKMFTIMPSGLSMRSLMKQCQETLFKESDIKALYTQIEKTTYCGGFCHR